MKSSAGPVPGRNSPARHILVARANPECAFGILKDVKKLIAVEPVAVGIGAQQVTLIQRCYIIGRSKMIKTDISEYPPLTFPILKHRIRGPQRDGLGRKLEANTPKCL